MDSEKQKISVSAKVAMGYAFVLCIFCAASFFIYRYVRSAIRLSDVERYVSLRSEVTNHFMFGMLEVEHTEKMLLMGDDGAMPGYERAMAAAKATADSLKLLVSDPKQKARTDSLKALLDEKYANTMQLMQLFAPGKNKDLYEEKLDKLLKGKDSVVVRHNAGNVSKERKTTYVVEKTNRKFFNRLADAFRRPKSDTTAVLTQTDVTAGDSVSRTLNVGDTVASMLSDIHRKDQARRNVRRNRYNERGIALRQAGLELAGRMRLLIDNINTAEQKWLTGNSATDTTRRHGIMTSICLLAAVAVVLAVAFLFFILRDIRRANLYRDRLDAARRRAESLLEQRERLLLTITHDIKSPVASISGFAEMLKAHVNGGRAAGYIANIRSSAAHLLQLVGALHDYHALENGRMNATPVTFSPFRLLADCTDSFRPQAASKHLSLHYGYRSEPSALFSADAFRIRQIAENLIGNAIKYTAEGGVEITAGVADSMLELSVADTGMGMTGEESRRVFNAFTRLPGAQGIEGVGLGLSITRELVTLLHGSISLTSARGRGTTFVVTIPLAPAGATTDGGKRPEAVENVADGVKELDILVIDDDAMQLQLMGDMLSSLGKGRWHVTLCSRIEDMFAHLETGSYDIVFTDIEMPGMNGFEIIRKIGNPRLPVVAMTAHDALAVSHFEEAGFASCLFKPFTAGHLSKVIARLTGSTPEDGADAKSTADDGGFSALTAFAAGDPDAGREILKRFREETTAHIAVFRESIDKNDFSAIPALAHKLIPVFTMIHSTAAPLLRRLADMRHEPSVPADMEDICRRVLAELEDTASRLDAITGGTKA